MHCDFYARKLQLKRARITSGLRIQCHPQSQLGPGCRTLSSSTQQATQPTTSTHASSLRHSSSSTTCPSHKKLYSARRTGVYMAYDFKFCRIAFCRSLLMVRLILSLMVRKFHLPSMKPPQFLADLSHRSARLLILNSTYFRLVRP